jgi:hypothetical protein
MASNIIFIVGNGLDLSLGMKTSYKDFYDYAMANKLHPKHKIYEAIKKDPETWSDFELTLGRYTRYLEGVAEGNRKQASVEFHDELEEVTQDLADYLVEQDKLSSDLTSDIDFARDDFYEELPVGQKDRILPHFANGATRFSFVTLNYTNSLENIFPHRNVTLVPQGIVISDIHHIHGDLSENVTLGVSDESQLYEGMSDGEKADLIKPQLIASMNDGRMEALRRIIDTSSILVLFGTSMGETDKYLWDYIVRWLASNGSRYIVIHKHDSSYTESVKRISRRQKLFVSSVQDQLLNQSSLDDSAKASLIGRIFVVHNTKKLFRADAS